MPERTITEETESESSMLGKRYNVVEKEARRDEINKIYRGF